MTFNLKSDNTLFQIIKHQIKEKLAELINRKFDIVLTDAETIKICGPKEIVLSLANFSFKDLIKCRANWIEYLKNLLIENFSKKEKWLVEYNDDFDHDSGDWACVDVLHKFGHVYHGMACEATQFDMEELKSKNSGIKTFCLEQEFSITSIGERKELSKQDLVALAQSVGPFVVRTGANGSSQKSGDGFGTVNSSVNVFVVDTGIATHPELNIVGGRNFVSTNTGAWADDNGHGTHVSGIIGARDNTNGIVGIAPGVRLWALKVLSASGSGSSSGIIAALDWILANRNILWQGVAVVNMSLGGGIFSPLDAAVEKLANQGIIVCVAAGNSSIDANNSSPARTANAITVAASSPTPIYTNLASFSNYGAAVDIVAPGTSITSTYLGGGYATMSGTSMACPVVTGTAALLVSRALIPVTNNLTYTTQIRNKIVNDSSILTPQYFSGGIGTNPRVVIPLTKPCTNISVWAGSY